MRNLYPEIAPRVSTRLVVDAVHTLYVEESGNRDGNPVIFLHGGPGSGCNENHRRYFDPAHYRIVIFDQRGCNRSVPQGETRNNTTQDLLNDIECIRTELQIKKWMVFGGSWGAALGLLYAQAFPERVLALLLRGTFLARQQDLDWFAKTGVNRIFPDAWAGFIQVIPQEERHDIVAAFYRRLHGHDEEEKLRCAKAWSSWAGRVVTYLLPGPEIVEEDNVDKIVHEVSIETHYAKHRYFIEENQILDNIKKLPQVPIKIIHGRRDLTCPLEASWELHKAIGHSELAIIREGGHLAGEAVMTDALVQATDDMARMLA